MRVPLSWLKDYVEIDVPAAELAQKLTGVGVPVELVEYISPDVTGVYAGFIKIMKPHPNADKLRIAMVDLGDQELRQIITGAPNVQEGDVVPVAVHGAHLAGDLKIKKSKIRGEESDGMMCSAKELGIDIKDLPVEQREGVLILPPDTPPGASLIDLYCLNDPVLVIESFANRPDQLSILGIAKEVAALLGKKMKEPPIDFPETGEKAPDVLSIKIQDFGLCRKYSGRVIADMPVAKSPLWMQGRLYAAGMRAINNVVDVTNYVMIETGQPLHAFDYALVKGQKIIVRPAKDGEKIMSLDGIERTLEPSMMVIADESDPVAIAGVMGGLDSEVGDKTGRILLESANFNPVSIRRTSTKLGLRSESSRRFEKGIDFHRVDFASRRACHLLAQFGGKILSGEAVDSETPPENPVLDLRPDKVRKVLGADIENAVMKKLLESLDFVVAEKGENFVVTVPSIRQDIGQEADLIEEVARLYGYDNIPSTHPLNETQGGYKPERAFDHRLREIMARCGLYECITLSMHEEKVLEDFHLDGKSLLRVKNPITEDQAVMRADAIPHLFLVTKRNLSARSQSLMTKISDGSLPGILRKYYANRTSRLFEISNLYDLDEEDRLRERRELSIMITGESLTDQDAKSSEADFRALKGIIEFLLSYFGIGAEFVQIKEKDEYPYLQLGRSAEIISGDEAIGIIGVLDIIKAHNLGVDQYIALARIFIDKIRDKVRSKKYYPIPRFPGILRDLALIVDKNVLSGDIQKIIMDKGSPIILDSYCFDCYIGTQIPEGKKSLAFTLLFSAPDRTLIEQEVQEKIDAILLALGQEMNAVLRSS